MRPAGVLASSCLAAALLVAAFASGSPDSAAPAARAPAPTEDEEPLPGALSAESLRLENELAARSTEVVLVLAALKDAPGSPRASSRDPAPIQRLLGDAGVLIDELRVSEEGSDRPVWRVTGRAGLHDSVRRLLTEARRRPEVELLWVSAATVPPDATEPVPLTTVLFSPRLYPSKGSMVHVGPSGHPIYYVPGTRGQIVEGSWDGSSFRTAYYSLQKPPYVEGGEGGLNLSRLGWQWRVSAWVREQDEIRKRGWEKYGYLFARPPAAAPPDAAASP